MDEFTLFDERKRCKQCREYKQRSEFHKNKSASDGLVNYCKDCKRSYDQQYCQDNREKKREQGRRWYEANIEHKREYDKQYRADNAEHQTRVNRQWYDDNREHKQEYDRQRRETHYEQNKRNHKRWREANKDHIRQYAIGQRVKHAEARAKDVRKRRARKEQAPGNGATLSELIAVHGPLCYLCDNAEADTVEHVTPLSRGGTNYPENLRPACHPCNARKANRTYDEYVKYLAL